MPHDSIHDYDDGYQQSDPQSLDRGLERYYLPRCVQAKHRHLTVGYRWEAVVVESRSNVEISQGDMDQVRLNKLVKWDRALIIFGTVPDNNRIKIVKGLSGCFTHRDNPHQNNGHNAHFQRKLDELIQEDVEYYRHPTVPRLCDMVAKLIYKWEQIHQQFMALSEKLGPTSASSALGK